MRGITRFPTNLVRSTQFQLVFLHFLSILYAGSIRLRSLKHLSQFPSNDLFLEVGVVA
jgi:hypothetical protein